MSQYTAEQVEEAAATDEHHLPLRVREMLRAYAAILRERENPLQHMSEALNVIETWASNGCTLSGDDVPRFRAAADRIAPMEVTGERVERAAKAMWETRQRGAEWGAALPSIRNEWRLMACAALETARPLENSHE